MSEALTAAEVIARRLYDAGCRYAFGIPGGEVLSLIDALDRAGLKVLLAKHENCAGFMGEGVHHHDGAPAVLFATIGPGLANAANVIANAQQTRATAASSITFRCANDTSASPPLSSMSEGT